ncbi:zinc-ribbon domain-containing protein [Micromonospora sp. DR5-3]|uniref:zinc-ribbon domain-containing protein n=1 Tax=unclassified Micromonospora TaxID=2617518 RepID=UPI002103243D|nr:MULTISPECIES: zinc-ribbon domain-containing protein [unclassified Micromonospora]MCW3817778.1 zinc-ribbon domain-containing protein [Micromonospora sp. DR5-3]
MGVFRVRLGYCRAMFFIFGLRTKVVRSGVVTEVCRNCGNQAAQVITRRATKFTLFFVPLIPVHTRWTKQCTFCGAQYDIPRAEAERLPVG